MSNSNGMSPERDPCLVVIGASAGGIEAMEQLVSALPAEFAAPIVLAQHLDPTRKSQLAEVLQPLTQLRVVSLEDKTKLEAGVIHVIPAGRNVEIDDGHVTLSTKMRRTRPQPSIDLLFETAAEAYGDRTIAVVLSGTGTDGPAGVRAVKEVGGTVVVQDPVTASYASLPASIPPSHIDFVVPLESLGTLLASMASNKDVPDVLNDDDMLKPFLNHLKTRSGIDFSQYKMPTILRRLGRQMKAAHCNSIAEYMRYLNSHPDAYQHLVGSFLIKVTGFFRDPSLYKHLREQALPEIIERARASRADIRVWSAGCATGEEPYSVAILLAELLGDEISEFNVRIFATDLDSDSIVFARRGLYSAAALSNVPPEIVKKYFTSTEDGYQIRKQVRNLTVFGEYDLGQRAPFPRIDLILCRNVLIYFTKELQQRTLQIFAFSLRDGGYLVLGKAETVSPLAQHFRPIHPALKIFRREGERLQMAPPAFVGGAANAGGDRAHSRSPLRALPARKSLETAPRWTLTERLGSFLLDAPMGIVVVDRSYDIQTINQSARNMLEIHGAGIGDDLIHLTAALGGATLKDSLDAVFRGENVAARQLIVHEEGLGTTRYLRVACFADRTSAKDTHVHAAIVVVSDVTDETRRLQELQQQNAVKDEETSRLVRLAEHLQERQRALMSANGELTAANNDLRTTNEHLLIAAEEAVASAEEVETLNEEMQATSEELETLNEELQATVEELNTTNEELGARGSELERLTGALEGQLQAVESQRDIYARALSFVPLSLALIDAEGRIAAASGAYNELSARMRALRAAGERWVAPDGDGLTVTEIPLDGAGGLQRLVFVTRNAEN